MQRRTFVAGSGAAVAMGTARAAFAQTPSMAALIAAAKAEGGVVVDGPPNDEVRKAFVEGFQRDYGIPLSYIASGSSASAARVRAERSAGKYLLDVFMSGSDTPIVTFLPGGWLDKIEPALIEPDVVDKRKWKDGHLWYEDDAHMILRVQQFIVPELAINTKFVKRNEVSTWKALLNPKWQGKIVAKDPTITGAGASLTSLFYIEFGADFVKRLYVGQKPALSRNPRQSAQWLADGTYPIQVGADLEALTTFQKLGYPVEPVFPTDAPSVLTGGFGLVCLMNKPQHPNAAKLFVNWLAGPVGQEAYAKATRGVSLRNDIKYDSDFPAYVFPQKGVKYMDTYDLKFVTEQRDPALQRVRELLGQ
jgi:iron(III) transport system substrate-binding protein